MAVLPPGVATFFFLVLKGPWLDRNEVKNIELKGLRFNNTSKKWRTGHINGTYEDSSSKLPIFS